MNATITTLNQWGGSFLTLAGPMLWQSSFLALVILLVDVSLRQRVRPAVRHGLWLVLLVKLVLPPSLALPTSPAWWWSRRAPDVAVAPPVLLTAPGIPSVPPAFVEMGDVSTMPDLGPAGTLPLPVAPPPHPPLTWAGEGFLVAMVGSMMLLFWLGLRYWLVLRAGRAAGNAPELEPLLAEVQALVWDGWRSGRSEIGEADSRQGIDSAATSFRRAAAGTAALRGTVRVKISSETMSPAVCGLFRPVILLPQALADTLTPEQLRAVLLHELVHVRRGDVWVNLAQGLLQIVYWWHPLVWLANARIRRVREEAVDDAVMVALRDDADIYAPTLLAVARFALHRPLASLGLVGILESRSALRQRIERLVNLPVPRRAGLSLVSVFALLAFSAVALPMGDAPPLLVPPAPDQTIHETVHFNSDPLIPPSQVATDMATPEMEVESAGKLHTCVYSVDTNSFLSLLAIMGGPPGANFLPNHETPADDLNARARHLFRKMGVDLTPPKMLFYNDRCGLLFAKATQSGLDTIKGEVDALNQSPISGPRLGETRFGTLHPTNSQAHYYLAPLQQARLDGPKSGPNNPPSTGTNASDDLMQAGSLVQDGKLSYETGRLDEAETALNRALALNRENAAAQYYLALVKEAQLDAIKGSPKASPPEAPVSPPRVPAPTRPVFNAFGLLANTGLPEFHKETGLTNSNSQEEYWSAFAKMLPTIKLPTNSVWLDDRGLFLVQGTPKEMAAVERLFETLNGYRPGPAATAKRAEPNQPTMAPPAIKPADTNLFMRTFKVNTNEFYPAVIEASGENLPAWPITSSNSAFHTELTKQLRGVFARFNMDLSAQPKAFFYNERLQLLFVKATAADLDVIERIVEVFDEPPAGERLEKKPSPQRPSSASAGGVLFAGSKSLTADPIFDQSPDSNAPVVPPSSPASTPEPPPTAPSSVVREVYTGAGRHDIVRKLDSILLERVDYDRLPLSEVLRRLSPQIKELDPAKTGINFLIDPTVPAREPKDTADEGGETDLGSIVINLSLAHVRLADVLDAIVLVADHPLAYSIHDFAVVFHARLPEALQGMNFKVDPGTFAQGLEAVGATSFGGTGNSGMAGTAGSGGTVVPKVFMAPGVTGGPGANSPENEPMFTNKPTSDSARTNNVAADFLKAHGIVLIPPKEASYNAKRGLLYIKGTKADLKQVRAVLEEVERSHDATNRPPGKVGATNSLNDSQFRSAILALENRSKAEEVDEVAPNMVGNPSLTAGSSPVSMPPQIHIRTVFIETDGAFGAIACLTNRTDGQTLIGIQSALDAAEFAREMETAPGSTILGEPEITMTTGRYAKLLATPMIRVAKGGQRKGRDSQSVTATTADEDFGQVFEVSPHVNLDDHTIDFKGTVSWTDLTVGAASGASPTIYNDVVIQPITGIAEPVIRNRRAAFRLRLYDGQTMVLCDRAPLRAIPMINTANGRAFPTEAGTRKHFLMLVTATLVDAAGNRIATDDKISFPLDQFLPTSDYDWLPPAIKSTNNTGLRNSAQSVSAQSETATHNATTLVGSGDGETSGAPANQVRRLNEVQLPTVLPLPTVQSPPTVHLQSYFFEVTGEITNRLALLPSRDGQAGVGFLGAVPAKISWNDLVASTNNIILGEHEISTVSGRKTRLSMMEPTTIPTGMKEYTPLDSSISRPLSDLCYLTNEQTGLVFDVLPTVREDGGSIDLNATLINTECVGLDGSTNGGPASGNDSVMETRGRFKAVLGNRQLHAHITVPRGQTIILYDHTPKFYMRVIPQPWHPWKPGDGSWSPETTQTDAKHLVVLVTVTVTHGEDHLNTPIPPYDGPDYPTRHPPPGYQGMPLDDRPFELP